ncbi:GATOR complex protein MIOS-B [Venturia canescens]|uniref:GATOR complex protein MIOS-B n=1 Tax=Venturia canescens TaxID=32260 RepID=UPI001C9D1638|nr:GATOR complex protein MIOS-B [Venturia canescens]XP_043268496.1 GATOR complex protein MIOS-B [Venturia canescens]
MNSVKLEVQWSPIHLNKFITWGTEICLYEVGQMKDSVRPSCQKISDSTFAHLLATNSSHNYLKCIDIYPRPEPDILLAVGQANGKVVLTTFGPTAYDSQGLTGRELAPKHARQCNAVAWNPVDPNLIVSGLDKYRTDHSVLLWDIQRTPIGSDRVHHHPNVQTDTIKPIAEAGVSETTHSLAWFNNESRCLVAGINNKQLKIIDFRDSIKVVNATPTKAVYSVSVNPHNDFHIVSHVENQITIWDTRYFEKPVLTLLQARQISKVLWCPTRHNLLGTLQKDSGALHLHDIQHCGVGGSEEIEPGALERTVAPPWSSPTSFSWHPSHINRLLAISQQGLTDYTVYERITVNWSTRSYLAWNHALKSFKYVSSSDNIYKAFDDISVLTKSRALSEYGLLPELAQNGELAENETLKNLWQWLYLSRSLVEDGTIPSTDNKHPGVRTVLKLDGQQNGFIKADLVQRPWTDIGSNYTAKMYRSADRDKALQLCGWRFDKESNALYNNLFLERLEREGAYARATAISVFNLCLRQAIEILNRGASKMSMSTNLNIVAMALSGFSEDRNSMWRELCLKSRSQLSDPYLRSTFAFLTADNDSYESVLNENGMAVEDRVAFALMFLSDSKLCDYLKKLTQKLSEEGNLAGFLLTGASLEGIQLLNRYLEITGDVQSCSLIAIRALSPRLLQENQVEVWIASYRGLLDAWKMWNQRAHFDIVMRSSTSEKLSQQVSISCNFCGKSISAVMQGLSRARGPFGRLASTSNKLKMSSCPSCRKPLPRCAICLMHMGTVSGLQLTSGSSNRGEDDSRLTEFSNWFTWCQTCRHGGHTNHITHWFRQHSECPVTSCTCRCFSLDASCTIGPSIM